MLALSDCGYNQFQALDEKTKSAWSEVLNQYQRRADLVPNIVASVKGQANFEQETLTKVIEARVKATAIQATPELANNPEALKNLWPGIRPATGWMPKRTLTPRSRRTRVIS